MSIKVFSIPGYTIDELEPKVRDRVLDAHRYMEVECADYIDDIECEVNSHCEDTYGISIKLTHYDIYDHNLGFSIESIDQDKLAEYYLSSKDAKPFIGKLIKVCDDFNIEIEHSRNYRSQNVIGASLETSLLLYSDDDISLIDAFLNDLVLEIRKNLLADITSAYEYLTSDECITETIGDWFFTAKGDFLSYG